jgi:hypothetical protein
MGLDEKAVEAVKRYRFKPAMLQGKPVPVEVNIEVNFKSTGTRKATRAMMAEPRVQGRSRAARR